MTDYLLDIFPNNEKEKREKLFSLFADWKAEMAKSKVEFEGYPDLFDGDKYFCYDGFLPHYFSQDIKVLFIAREATWITTACEKGEIKNPDNIEVILKDIKNGEANSKPLYRNIIYMAFGIKNQGKIPFDHARESFNEICDEIIKGKTSFALMEISKYSNDDDDAPNNANVKLMAQSFKNTNLSKRNFIKEELELLDPDIIITANLWDSKLSELENYLDLTFDNVRYLPDESIDNLISVNELFLNGKKLNY